MNHAKHKARKAWHRWVAILLFGLLAVPLMLLNLFQIAWGSEIAATLIGTGLGWAAYRFHVWPAVLVSLLVVFGIILPSIPPCSDPDGCEGAVGDAWPEKARWIAAYVLIVGTGVGAGALRSLLYWYASRPTTDSQGKRL